jgi:hypothetical protein
MTPQPVPFPHSYWVIPGKLLAGYYPGSKDPKEATTNTRATDDVVSVAHYSQPGCAWGSETTIPVAHTKRLILWFTLVCIPVCRVNGLTSGLIGTPGTPWQGVFRIFR